MDSLEEIEVLVASDSGDREDEKSLEMTDWVKINASDDEAWTLVTIKHEANDRKEEKEEEEDFQGEMGRWDQEEKEEVEDSQGEMAEWDQEEEEEREVGELEAAEKPRAPVIKMVSKDTSTSFVSELVRERSLQRLPAKSLLRLRAVSTVWNNYISSPFFAHTHAWLARSLSGVFYQPPGSDRPAYASFGGALHGLPDPALCFLPEPVSVHASAHGLLCCRGRLSDRYYVTNPLISDWVELPLPDNNHGPHPELVLVLCEPLAYNFSADYYLVCAYEVDEGVYSFETFSSKEWQWTASGEVCFLEMLVPGSGVAAGEAAYWRTTMQTVISYVPKMDSCQELCWPGGYKIERAWELAELRRRLCCVCVRYDKVTVYELGDGGENKWKKVETLRELRQREEVGGSPMPLRVQGASELLFWQDLAVFARDMDDGGMRVAEGLVPYHCMDFVPYVSSLVRAQGWSLGSNN